MTDSFGSPTNEPAVPPEDGTGPATRLFRSLTNLVATLVMIAQTRLELLTTELQEEVQRAVGVALWASVALFAGIIGLFFGGLTVVFYFWDTHRVLAALCVTASFAVLAVVATLVLFAKANARTPFLDATRSELAKDAQALRERLE